MGEMKFVHDIEVRTLTDARLRGRMIIRTDDGHVVLTVAPLVKTVGSDRYEVVVAVRYDSHGKLCAMTLATETGPEEVSVETVLELLEPERLEIVSPCDEEGPVH